RRKPGRGARIVLDLAGVTGLAALIWSFRIFTFSSLPTSDTRAVNGVFLLVDVATLLVIAAVVHPRSDVGPLLGCPPLRWIGLRSYGLYLWHYPIFCLTRPGLDIHRVGIWFLSFRYVR